MPSKNPDINFRVAATDEASAVFNRVGASLKKLGGEANATFGGRLKAQASSMGIGGETSLLAMLKGGGALAGVTIATQAMETLAERLKEINEGMASGAKTTGDMVGDMLKAIPVAGGLGDAIYRLGVQVRDMTAAWGLWSKSASTVAAEGERVKRVLDDMRGTVAGARWTALAATFGHDKVDSFDIAEAKRRKAVEDQVREMTQKAAGMEGPERDEAYRRIKELQGWEAMRRRAASYDRELVVQEAYKQRMEELGKPFEQRRRLAAEKQDARMGLRAAGLQALTALPAGVVDPDVLQRMQIMQEYASARAPWEALLKAPGTTGAQSQAIREIVRSMEKQANLRLEQVGAAKRYEANAPTSESRFLSGFGAAGNAAEQRSVELNALTKQQRDLMERMVTLIQKFFETGGIF